MFRKFWGKESKSKIELIEKNIEELSVDDTKIMDRVRRVEKDVQDLLVYLDVERKEWWEDDESFTPAQPRLKTSKWVKRDRK